MNIDGQTFDFTLVGENRQGAEVAFSFSLPLDGEYTKHFSDFLSRVMADKIKIGNEVLSDISRQYCLELANKVAVESHAL